MNDIMYDVPSDERVRKCIITEDTVNGVENLSLNTLKSKKNLNKLIAYLGSFYLFWFDFIEW